MPHFSLGGGGASQLGGLDLLAGLVHHANGHVIGCGLAFVKGDQIIALTAFTNHDHIACREKLPIADANVSRTGAVFDRDTIHDTHRNARVGQQLHRGPIAGTLIARKLHHLEAEIEGCRAHAQTITEEVGLDLGPPTRAPRDRAPVLTEVGEETRGQGLAGEGGIHRSDGRLRCNRLAVAIEQSPNRLKVRQFIAVILPPDHHVTIPTNGHTETFSFAIVENVGGVDIHSLAHRADTVVFWLGWKRLAVNLTGQQGSSQKWQ